MAPADFVARAQALGKRSSEMLRLGSVKIVTDGSIQGFTARLKWPGHLGGQPNGIWNVPPKQLFEVIEALNAARVQMHIHTNGDEASEVTLDALEAALCKSPWPDHRHTLQHVQMAGEDQFARMAAMGVCANLFANHMWYFGDAPLRDVHRAGPGPADGRLPLGAEPWGDAGDPLGHAGDGRWGR